MSDEVGVQEDGGDDGRIGEKSEGAARQPGLVPGTDGPALADLMRMDEDEWDAFARSSASRRGPPDRGSPRPSATC